MSADADMVTLFKKELDLCKVGPGTSLAVLSEGDVRADYAAVFLAAAEDLGADAFQVNIKKRPGSFFGPGNSLKGNAPALAALKGVDIVIDLVGLLWSEEQTEITAAGPRMLLVIEHIEVLRRMLSTPDDKAAHRGRRRDAGQGQGDADHLAGRHPTWSTGWAPTTWSSSTDSPTPRAAGMPGPACSSTPPPMMTASTARW